MSKYLNAILNAKISYRFWGKDELPTSLNNVFE